MNSDLAYNLPNYIDSLDNWITKRTKKIIAINIHQDYRENNKIIREYFSNFLEKNALKYDFLFITHDYRKKVNRYK